MLMPKPKTRAGYVMVDENDPHFAKFWDTYPKRQSKKDARKAWAKLNPDPALVARMLGALEWQIPHHRWAGEKFEYAPLPATWLNKERWKDEAPPQCRKSMSDAAAMVFETLGVKL